jgi:hypothetical protein
MPDGTIATKMPNGHVTVSTPERITIIISPHGSRIIASPPDTKSVVSSAMSLAEETTTIQQKELKCDSISYGCDTATITEVDTRGRGVGANQGHDQVQPVTTTSQDGTISSVYPDGTKIIKQPDGTTKTTHNGGTEVTDKPGLDGSTVIKKPNGTIITVDAFGNIDKTIGSINNAPTSYDQFD